MSPFMMQLSAQDSLTFIRLRNSTRDFFGSFVASRNFFFCLVFATIHLMSDPRHEVEGNIRTRRKTKVTAFWRDLTLNVLLYNFWTFTSTATKK